MLREPWFPGSQGEKGSTRWEDAWKYEESECENHPEPLTCSRLSKLWGTLRSPMTQIKLVAPVFNEMGEEITFGDSNGKLRHYSLP